MITVRDIETALLAKIPARWKMDWDNVGLLCGHYDSPVTRVMVALDAMPDVFDEAKAAGCELILTHHPVIFGSFRSVNDDDFTGRNILWLIENGIAAINLHTNFDVAPEGVNQILAETVGLRDIRVIDPTDTDDQGRDVGLLHCGTVEPTELRTFTARVKEALHCPGIRFADAGKPVHFVAVGGGACGSELAEVAAAGCDTFVSAEFQYNDFEEAKYRGVNLVDAGHFCTENPACAYLERLLRELFPELCVLRAKNHKDEMQFL